ncbi:MAG TPA: alpha/beta hydrolase [Rhizomicrobium sp.]|jgi:pimeloyl-ACP methyl ester carboxylesterase|nr:alpha/beta hydrolase [Rhizomicrobium sp.]
MAKFLIGLLAVIAVIAGAFWYYSTPDIPRGTLEAKYGTPPSQFITLADGASAHVRDVGPRDAPVLVLIHGSNASLFTWSPWVARLKNNFRVVTMDMPGHGLTGAVPSNDYSQEAMVEFVKHVTDKLGLPAFAIGGNSMGGGIAARFAETYPARVTHLILVDAAGMNVKQGDKIPLAFRLARIPVLNQILLHITPRKLVVEGLNDAIVRKSIITNTMIDQYWDFARMEGTRRATMLRFQNSWDTYVADHIAQIKAPTLILWGAEDHLIPVEAAHKFAAAIPGSKLVIYPATGHIPQEEVPDQSAAAVRAFLTPAAQASAQ